MVYLRHGSVVCITCHYQIHGYLYSPSLGIYTMYSNNYRNLALFSGFLRLCFEIAKYFTYENAKVY